MFKFSRRSKDRMKGIDPRLIQLFDRIIKVSPIDIGIPQDAGLRTPRRQKELFNLGKSKCDGIHNISKHQTGKAIDFYAYINGKASWDRVHLAIISGCAFAIAADMGIKIKWGAKFGSNNFHGWDSGHIELID